MEADCNDMDSPNSPTNVLLSRLKYLIPDLTWKKQRRTWAGLRPMTPDNLPYVGLVNQASSKSKVYVCCGHGATGWTSSTATAEILSKHVFPSLDGEDKETMELMESMRPDRFENIGVLGNRWVVKLLDMVL